MTVYECKNCNNGVYMKAYEPILWYMNAYENVWMYMSQNDSIRKYMMVYECKV